MCLCMTVWILNANTSIRITKQVIQCHFCTIPINIKISFETKTVIGLLIIFQLSYTISVPKMNLSWPRRPFVSFDLRESGQHFKMGTKSPGAPQRCRLILQQCLAIQLTKPGHTPEDFWMYDSGYMIFQVSLFECNLTLLVKFVFFSWFIYCNRVCEKCDMRLMSYELPK